MWCLLTEVIENEKHDQQSSSQTILLPKYTYNQHPINTNTMDVITFHDYFIVLITYCHHIVVVVDLGGRR